MALVRRTPPNYEDLQFTEEDEQEFQEYMADVTPAEFGGGGGGDPRLRDLYERVLRRLPEIVAQEIRDIAQERNITQFHRTECGVRIIPLMKKNLKIIADQFAMSPEMRDQCVKNALGFIERRMAAVKSLRTLVKDVNGAKENGNIQNIVGCAVGIAGVAALAASAPVGIFVGGASAAIKMHGNVKENGILTQISEEANKIVEETQKDFIQCFHSLLSCSKSKDAIEKVTSRKLMKDFIQDCRACLLDIAADRKRIEDLDDAMRDFVRKYTQYKNLEEASKWTKLTMMVAGVFISIAFLHSRHSYALRNTMIGVEFGLVVAQTGCNTIASVLAAFGAASLTAAGVSNALAFAGVALHVSEGILSVVDLVNGSPSEYADKIRKVADQLEGDAILIQGMYDSFHSLSNEVGELAIANCKAN